MNSTGTLLSSQSYDVYGEQGGGTAPGGFGFAGEQADSSTGLQYLRARYYDSATGRFISRDPMSAQPVWTGSPYAYAGANPVSLPWRRPGMAWSPAAEGRGYADLPG